MDEMQHAANVYRAERIEKGVVHRLPVLGILEAPAASFFDVDMLVLTGGNPLIDGDQAVFQLLFKRG